MYIVASESVAYAKDTLNIPLQYDIIHLDPAELLDTDSAWIATQLYEGLFELRSSGDIAPRLISSWRVDPDGKTYYLSIKRHVNFSDGSKLTTRDIAYTLTRLLQVSKRERPYLIGINGSEDYIAGRKSNVEGIRIVDDYNIDIEFRVPMRNFPRILTSPSYYILPARYSAQISSGSFFRSPVGTGPFVIERWIRGRELILKRNVHYWGGRPQLHRISFSFYDPHKPWTNEQLYQFDMLLALPAYSKKVPSGFSSRWYNRPVVEFIGFNMRHPFWRSLNDRRAFSQIFNKASYYETLFRHRKKSWHVNDSVIPRGLLSLGGSSSRVHKVSSETLVRVKDYLNNHVKKIYFASHHHIQPTRLHAALKNSLGTYISEHVDVVRVTPDSLLKKVRANEVGFFFMRLVADTFDPYEILVYFSGDAPHDFTGYTDPAYTKTLRLARMQLDEHKRAMTYAELGRKLSDDIVVIPIASMFNERLFIRSTCTMKNFGPLGPWYYRLDNIVCK